MPLQGLYPPFVLDALASGSAVTVIENLEVEYLLVNAHDVEHDVVNLYDVEYEPISEIGP